MDSKDIFNQPKKDPRFIQPEDISSLPVLEPPVYQNKTSGNDGEVAYSNGLPVLEPPKYQPREDRAVRNDPRKHHNETDDNGLPILRTPDDNRR